MGVRRPLTLTTCPGLSADHPHFLLKGLSAPLSGPEKFEKALPIVIIIIIIMFVVCIVAQFLFGFLLSSFLQVQEQTGEGASQNVCA